MKNSWPSPKLGQIFRRRDGLYFDGSKIPKIVRVCSILHNICVDGWVKNNPLLQYDNKGNRHWPESAEHDCVFDADPQDVEIMERLRNVYSETRRASSDNCVKK